MQTLEEFPKELFVEIIGDDYREARLTVIKLESSFNVEIDIVQIETKKIWKHVGIIFNISDEQEATDRAIQELSLYLQNPK